MYLATLQNRFDKDLSMPAPAQRACINPSQVKLLITNNSKKHQLSQKRESYKEVPAGEGKSSNNTEHE
jgi:hypothetical protein